MKVVNPYSDIGRFGRLQQIGRNIYNLIKGSGFLKTATCHYRDEITNSRVAFKSKNN
jgi:hypothetical protein